MSLRRPAHLWLLEVAVALVLLLAVCALVPLHVLLWTYASLSALTYGLLGLHVWHSLRAPLRSAGRPVAPRNRPAANAAL